jgi:hypothetical protein
MASLWEVVHAAASQVLLSSLEHWSTGTPVSANPVSQDLANTHEGQALSAI